MRREADPSLGRRTRPALLEAVEAEVVEMAGLGLAGPASLLVGRLAAKGVPVSPATIRAGDCRPLLETVWRRRPTSTARHGPTGGHDLRPVVELVDAVIDLKCRIGRIRADLRGEVYDRDAEVTRDPRSLAACARNERRVAATARLVRVAIGELAAAGVVPGYGSVARLLTAGGHPIDERTIRRQELYWRPILEFHDIEPPVKPADPQRAALSRLTAEELSALVHSLQRELRLVEAEFAATLV